MIRSLSAISVALLVLVSFELYNGVHRVKAQEQTLDDRSIEFPRVNEGLAGLHHDIVYAVDTGTEALISEGRSSIRKYDLKTGNSAEHVFRNGVSSEFVHIQPDGTRGEDDGWLIGFVYDRARNASDLIILDAQKIESKPVARSFSKTLK